MLGFGGFDLVRPWQSQGPYIGLVRCVGPVALILHLKGIAFHAAFDRNAGHGLMGDRTHILERLPRFDQIGQAGLVECAVYMLDPHRGACHADDWMQDAKAATVGFKACRCIRYGVESERAANLCLNANINDELGRIRAFATRLIGDGKAGVVLFNVQIMDFRVIGSPVAIPHQIGDGAQNLNAVIFDGAKIAVA